MNINSSFKIQNVRSLNLSSGIHITRKKIDALTHESDNIIFIINAQVGKHKQIVEKEFLTCKNGPYMTYFNSSSSRAAGVGIAIKLTSDIQVLKGIETLLRKIDSSQEIIIGSDWNNFTDRIKDQRGNQAKPHYRT